MGWKRSGPRRGSSQLGEYGAELHEKFLALLKTRWNDCQTDMARDCDISRVMMSNIVNRRIPVPVRILVLFAKDESVDLYWLFGRDRPKAKKMTAADHITAAEAVLAAAKRALKTG